MEEPILTRNAIPILADGDGYWYLATPYSKYKHGRDGACRGAQLIAGELKRMHVRVFSPVAHSHPIAITAGVDPLDWQFWMEHQQPFMDKARGLLVAMMSGWLWSQGVTAERKIFRESARAIYRIDPRDLDVFGT